MTRALRRRAGVTATLAESNTVWQRRVAELESRVGAAASSAGDAGARVMARGAALSAEANEAKARALDFYRACGSCVCVCEVYVMLRTYAGGRGGGGGFDRAAAGGPPGASAAASVGARTGRVMRDSTGGGGRACACRGAVARMARRGAVRARCSAVTRGRARTCRASSGV